MTRDWVVFVATTLHMTVGALWRAWWAIETEAVDSAMLRSARLARDGFIQLEREVETLITEMEKRI